MTRLAAIAAALLALDLPAAAQPVNLRLGDDFTSAVLAGRVCEDLDGDAVCSPSEPGIPAARIVLSDGTFAVTDGEGRYHLVAVPARGLEIDRITSEGGAPFARARDGYGRLLVKLDTGSLGRRALVRGGAGRVIEFGPAMLQAVDFAVAYLQTQTVELEPAGRDSLPAGEKVGGEYRYRLSGRTRPGHQIAVAGERVVVNVDGTFSAVARLGAGENTVFVSDLSPEGLLAFRAQRIAVVERERGGALFIPRPLELVATVSLSPPGDAREGRANAAIRAPEATLVRLGASEVAVGASGAATLAFQLQRGPNELAVVLLAPGLPPAVHPLVIVATGPSFTSALLSLELGYGFDDGGKELSLLGRGMAVLQRSYGGFDLAAGVDLDVGDLSGIFGQTEDRLGKPLPADPYLVLRPREPLAFERALDIELFPPATADDGLSGTFNPSRSRLWAHARHPTYGILELGSFKTGVAGAEIGRYERSLIGGLVDARYPIGPVELRARAFGSPAAALDGGPYTAPAHDELTGTGGSVFYLRNPAVIPGSEKLRVEIRDGLSALPLEERALLRYVDYDIDYASGRIILARPLPMNAGFGPLLTTPLQSAQPVLVADYEVRSTSAARSRVLGAGAGAGWQDAIGVFASVVDERRFDEEAAGYRLYSVYAKSRIGPFALVAEAARSEGSLFPPGATGGFNLSDTGGLAFLVAQTEQRPSGPADAFGLRASLSEDAYGGQVWVRLRDAGFSDSSHASLARGRQFGGRVRAEVGKVSLSLFADDRIGSDPRDPFGPSTVGGRDAVVRATLPLDKLALSAEGKFASLSYPEQVGGEPQEGGRAGLGVRADYQVVPELTLNASHFQRLVSFGAGPGSLDDTFSAVGAVWRPKDDLGLSARAGWGPGVGTQVQLGGERVGDGEVGYGSFTVDADGPDAGRAVMVSGARRRVEEEAEVFAEDLFARDIDALRLGRAVGIHCAPVKNLVLTGRYERGTRLPFTGVPALLRDSGSGRVTWMMGRLRVGAIAEVRRERGNAITESDVDRWQTLGALALEARPLDALGIVGRLNASLTRNRGRTEAQFVEGTLGAGLRIHPWIVLASYAIVNEIPPESQTASPRFFEHLVSLRPALLLGDRLRLGAGVHAGFFRGRDPTTIVAASIRPAVRIVGTLEAAVEAARRSAAPAGEALNALRAELAWWPEPSLGIAGGYNIVGFSGTGVARERGRTDRVYVRLELAY
ncbi:MAG: hypothetical protein ACOX6T_08575 [Myxococcales bacterium]|jgi:hypothetical protein